MATPSSTPKSAEPVKAANSRPLAGGQTPDLEFSIVPDFVLLPRLAAAATIIEICDVYIRKLFTRPGLRQMQNEARWDIEFDHQHRNQVLRPIRRN
jgi:hypothetical protein